MTTALELWDKLRQQPRSWLPTGEVYPFVLTPNERLTVMAALRSYVPSEKDLAHTDHPLRHFDRTCPACIAGAPKHDDPDSHDMAKPSVRSAVALTGDTPRTDKAQKEAEGVLDAYLAGPLTNEGLKSAVIGVIRILLRESRQLERELAGAKAAITMPAAFMRGVEAGRSSAPSSAPVASDPPKQFDYLKSYIQGEPDASALLIERDALAAQVSTLLDEIKSLRPAEGVALSDFDIGIFAPYEVLEWIWHMDLHLTEHDERHAGLALRAAWPQVRAYMLKLEKMASSVPSATAITPRQRERIDQIAYEIDCAMKGATEQKRLMMQSWWSRLDALSREFLANAADRGTDG